MRFPGQQRKCGPLASLDGAVALRVDALSLRDQQLESLLYQGYSRCCAPPSEEGVTCGICLDSVEQQGDIFGIVGPRGMPISQDSHSNTRPTDVLDGFGSGDSCLSSNPLA